MTADTSAAVDCGLPLLSFLASRHDVHKHTLRYASGFLKHRCRSAGEIPGTLWLLDGIKPAKRPTSEADMNVLCHAIDWILDWRLDSDRAYVDAVAATLYRNGITAFQSLLTRTCPSHHPENPFSDLAHV